jgi:hypothetical protein
MVLAWAAMADFLVFSALVSSSPSLLVSVGAAADGFVMESIVTSGQWGGPAFFFIISCFSWWCRRCFSGGIYGDCWTMRKTKLLQQ